MRIGSLFSGIGGFDRGFELAGMSVAWQCEYDRKARGVLQRHWPNVGTVEDVRTLTAGDVQPVDLICGGFPCQDLSVAGKRGGLDGERSGLWYEFHRILDELRPPWVVIENVPGLRSSQGGRDLAIILRGLGELGYLGSYWSPDAQYFGVAQRRRRVFIVGRLGDDGPPPVLFEPEGLRWNPAPSRETGASAAALTANGVGASGADDNQGQSGHLVAHTLRGEGFDASEDGTGRGTPIVPTHEVAPCLQERDGKGPDSDCTKPMVVHATQDPIVAHAHAHALSANASQAVAYQCHGSNVGPGGALRSGNGNVTGGVPFIPFDTTQITSAENRSNPQPGDPSHPLTASGDPPAIAHVGVRRLTPRECERLQGFPDDWTRWDADGNEQKDGPRYRQLGNAVAVPVAEWIGRRIMACR